MFNDDLKYFIYLIIALGVSLISIVIPKSDKILFFSRPDYSDNSKYIYQKMLDMNLNTKLDLIWAVYEKVDATHVKRRSLKYLFQMLTSKYIISTHSAPIWKSRNQIAVFTEHGLPFKASGHLASTRLINSSFKQRISLYITSKKIDYLLATSRLHAIILAATWRLAMDKIIITGFPRQDGLFDKQADKKALKFHIDRNCYAKLILYAPTFRDWNGNDLSDSLLKNKKFLKYLEQNNNLLIYKPHKNTKKYNLNIKFIHPNIIILENDDLIKKDIHLYELFPVFDVVITDYSSIFYETTLLDIPVIFYVPDIEKYYINRGFIFKPEKWLPGHMVKNINELLFALNECTTFDPYKEKRIFIKKDMNQN